MSLEKDGPGSILMALRPLYQNTVIAPTDKKYAKALAGLSDPQKIKLAMDDIGSRISWVLCGSCGKEWNALSEDGDCIDCFDKRKALEDLQVKMGQLLLKSIGPYGLEKYSFSSFWPSQDNELAVEAFRDFQPDRDNLYLWGNCGVGKTHLAGALLKACAAAGRRCRWTNSLYLTRALRGKFPADEEMFIDDLARSEVLIIDDLGLARDAETLLRLIYELADKRLHAKRNGWVVTTNFDLGTLTKRFGDDRLGSRLAGLFKFYHIQGDQDRRFER